MVIPLLRIINALTLIELITIYTFVMKMLFAVIAIIWTILSIRLGEELAELIHNYSPKLLVVPSFLLGSVFIGAFFVSPLVVILLLL